MPEINFYEILGCYLNSIAKIPCYATFYFFLAVVQFYNNGGEKSDLWKKKKKCRRDNFNSRIKTREHTVIVWRPCKLIYQKNKSYRIFIYLAVCGAIFFDDPTGLVAESLEDLVVVAVLRQAVVAVHPQPGVDFRADCAPASLSSFVVLPLPPCRHPRPRRHWSRDITVHVFLCVCMWERERWGGRRKCFWGMIYLQGKFGRRNYENATAREKGLVDLENGVLRFENGCGVNGNIRLCWADWMRYLSEWKHPDFLLSWLDVWMRYLNFGFLVVVYL